MPLRSEFIAAIVQCVGTPFLDQGRIIGEGLDCLGLILVGCMTVKLPGIDKIMADPRSYTYGRRPPKGLFYKRLLEECNEISPDLARPGDLLLQWIYFNHQHIMVMVGKNEVIHATEQLGKVTYETMTSSWIIPSAFQLPGIVDG